MTKEESALLLDKAAQICVMAHAGQRDKNGCAYFQHPMRVAMRCSTDEEKMVALLHDVIEDSDITPQMLLNNGFPKFIVDSVISISKRNDESYEEFVARAKLDVLGRQVKLHDIEDNLDILRLNEIDEGTAKRLNKYLKAYHYLKDDSLDVPLLNGMSIDGNYSYKAFAVYGDFKGYSESFKAHGGLLYLKAPNGPAWVFSKKRYEEIIKLITKN